MCKLTYHNRWSRKSAKYPFLRELHAQYYAREQIGWDCTKVYIHHSLEIDQKEIVQI
jgi:hypothetical protein